MDTAKLESLLVRLETAVAKLEGRAGGAAAPAAGGDSSADAASTSPSFLDYSAWLDSSIKPFVDASTALGDDIAKMGALVQKVFDAQKTFILLAAKHSKPADSDLQKILEPQVKAITGVTEFREASRRSKYFNHLSAVSEAIPAVSWICVSPTPGPYVKEMSDAAMFYTNRVLKEYRETSPEHVAWTKLLLGALRELQAYIKQHHTTGLTWNPQGSRLEPKHIMRPVLSPKPNRKSPTPPPRSSLPPLHLLLALPHPLSPILSLLHRPWDLLLHHQHPPSPLLPRVMKIRSRYSMKSTRKDLASHRGSPAKPGAAGSEKPKVAPKPRAAAGGAPPPPPPSAPGGPPPPPPPAEGLPAASAGGNEEIDRSALFAALNKGSDITAGLKKVTSDMQTHKNTALRKTSQVNSSAKPYSAPKPKSVVKTEVVKDPVFELDSKKWMIEYQRGNKGLTIDGNMKQTVYVFKCQDSTITVNGKVNSIILDTCKKCALVFNDSVAGIEVINSQRIQAQVTGKCPIINVDKTDGFQMYLSKESIDCEIITAKVSEINIMIPEGDDYTEKAVVEQFKTVWDPVKKQMVTTPVEICG
ncbi:Oidioi.mRNA.OKI2018_I69.chr1.g1842.t2.cds [Oikopleura dioica]|uniref:Oidioi.mRNA.OKI2018_I69.chr1.g1842.t2.cds n=1 Tax=Oikopleura dioica TaxID=34765 RepID=A0ABN7SP70_OIKDI|nr:Oidioi.mRNA.OKI2018_I69.chr1.g1842.t2.cds [Oikopleura dioica]